MADYLHGSLEITLSFVHARQALYQLSGFSSPKYDPLVERREGALNQLGLSSN